MNEENNGTITYDEGWKTVADREYAHSYSMPDSEYPDDLVDENNIPKKKKDAPKQLLITIQLILCLIAAAAAFAVKSIGGDIYQSARNWYYTNLKSSVIFDDSQKLDFNSLFGAATQDEAENT